MKKFIALILVLVLMLGLTGCGNPNNLTEKALRTILEQNNEFSTFDMSSLTLETAVDLDSDEYNKFVLISGSANGKPRTYYPVFVNTEKKQSYAVVFYSTLKEIAFYIHINENRETNIENFDKMVEYVKEYGINCFSSEETANKYVSEITGSNGIIPTTTARNVVIQGFAQAGNSNKDDFEIYFEKGTALSKYLAAKLSETVYNWNYPEAYLSTMDRETKATFQYMFGPAYVTKTVWEVAEMTEGTFKVVGKFDSLDTIPNRFNVDNKNTVSAPVPTPQQGILVMATNADFPPLEFRSSSTNAIDGVDGVDVAIARLIADELGKELRIIDMNFADIITTVMDGRADVGISGLSITEERLQNVNFSIPYFQNITIADGPPISAAIAIRKDNTELLEQINTILEKLISDGTINTLHRKYMEE